MEKQNCWEFKKCGREVGGKNTGEHGVCPAASFELADGFCGGKNGGRACVYIIGTLCSADVCDMHDFSKKEILCAECDFYKELKSEHGCEISLIAFHEFMDEKKKGKTKNEN